MSGWRFRPFEVRVGKRIGWLGGGYLVHIPHGHAVYSRRVLWVGHFAGLML